LYDLNDGLFNELAQARPLISLYRRDLQRAYVKHMVSSLSSTEGPSEFSVALRSGLADLATKIDQTMNKVRDPKTRAHLRDLRAALGA